MKSWIFQMKIKNKEKAFQRVQDIAKGTKKPTYDERKAMMIYEKQAKIDDNQINNTYKQKDAYLELAFK